MNSLTANDCDKHQMIRPNRLMRCIKKSLTSAAEVLKLKYVSLSRNNFNKKDRQNRRSSVPCIKSCLKHFTCKLPVYHISTSGDCHAAVRYYFLLLMVCKNLSVLSIDVTKILVTTN